MFKEIHNGTLFEIPDNAFGFIYKCWLPPFGYGIDSSTGAIAETDIIERVERDEDNYWVRPTLPKDFVARRKEEKKVRLLDKFYVDPYLEEIRVREWKRRLRGVWFYNYNPTTKQVDRIYITGLQYFYITYWKFQGKWMDFRIPDRDLFYVVEYCMQDPDCLGLNEMTKRKNGKTARVGCWLYERTSRLNNHHGGIQSKSDPDAEEVFKKAVIHPWQKLPDFFRPKFDTMKGDNPSEALMFFETGRRGSKTEEDYDDTEEPLESFIDFKPSSESAYDGPELHSYVSDESGKTKRPVSILERQNTNRFCTEIDGEMKGKHWFTTTVEPDKGEPENYEFQDMTANSNPLERDDNNRTGTGLYTYFLPAQKGMMFDKYGHAEEERALTFINNSIRNYELKGDTRKCSSFKRKNPRTFKEAFSTDGEFALYDPEKLNNQLDAISWTNKFVEKGNLVWKDGYRVKRPVQKPDGTTEWEPNEVLWEPNIHGKFEKLAGWFPENPNNVFYGAGSYFPNNTFVYAVGCDPFRYDKTKDKRRSNCAAFGYRVKDPIYPSQWDDHFTIRYAFREESTSASNEDVLKLAWWLGSEVLFERNVNHWKKDFNDWECAGFLTWMPGEVEPGIITSAGSGSGVQVICNYTEAYINKFIQNVYFKELIRKEAGWLGFKVEETEAFDEPMAAGITLIKVKGIQEKNKPQEGWNIQDFFPKRRA